jgi:hypothetical protein
MAAQLNMEGNGNVPAIGVPPVITQRVDGVHRVIEHTDEAQHNESLDTRAVS